MKGISGTGRITAIAAPPPTYAFAHPDHAGVLKVGYTEPDGGGLEFIAETVVEPLEVM